MVIRADQSMNSDGVHGRDFPCERRDTKIIKTIDEISFQTNLLALNAAVERPVPGSGCRVRRVAEEVRNLAMRAADAAKTRPL